VIALEIVIRRRLLSFVKITVCELFEPSASAPKLMDVGLTLMFACATLVKANSIVAAAVIVLTLILLLAVMCM
jgi:hypothetical protein